VVDGIPVENAALMLKEWNSPSAFCRNANRGISPATLCHVCFRNRHALESLFDILFVGLLCDLLWADPDKDINGWGENDRGVSFTFGPDVVSKFLNRHDLDLICRAHQVIIAMTLSIFYHCSGSEVLLALTNPIVLTYLAFKTVVENTTICIS